MIVPRPYNIISIIINPFLLREYRCGEFCLQLSWRHHPLFSVRYGALNVLNYIVYALYLIVYKLRAKFLCWCSNRHRSVDFNTTVGTCSRGGASGGVDDVCASHWRKISNHTKPNESAVLTLRCRFEHQHKKFNKFVFKIQPSFC